MTTYKSYAECKIANPDSEIVTTGKNWNYTQEIIGTFEAMVFDGGDGTHTISDEAGGLPAILPTIAQRWKEFLEAGFELVEGDKYIEISGKINDVNPRNLSVVNYPWNNDCERYIISAAALNGGSKIPAKAEQWTIYNNTPSTLRVDR